MKELFLITITKPLESAVNKFSVSVSFFLFPCSKEEAVRAYLDTIKMLLVIRFFDTSISSAKILLSIISVRPGFPQAQIFRLLFLSIFCLVFSFTYKYIAMAASYKSNKVMGLSATFTFIASNIALPPVYIRTQSCINGIWLYENSVFGPLGQPGQY